MSGRINAETYSQDGKLKPGFVFTVEPNIIKFGNKKQFDFNTAITFIQKGYQKTEMIYSYNSLGGISGIGMASSSLTLNYISLSPLIKYKFAKVLYIKAGPRVDCLVNYNFESYNSISEYLINNKFNPVTAGVTIGGGICIGKRNVKFIAEIMEQADVTNSAYNKATKKYYRNFSHYINCGIVIDLKKKQ